LDCILLPALLWESRGYTAWFLDNLSESIQAFSRAINLWKRTCYNTGMAVAWNNLAAISEETGLPHRAERYYRMALNAADSETPDEIRFSLNRNLALFLNSGGRKSEATKFLQVAAMYSQSAPVQYRLAAARIEERLDDLISIEPRLPGLKAEKAIFQAQLLQSKGAPQEAETALRKAIKVVVKNGNFYFRRRLIAEYGRLLEREGRYSEAASLYHQFLSTHPALPTTELLFPISGVISPFLKGWIRCQVRSNRPGRARRAIHTYSLLRKKKATRILSLTPQFPVVTGEIDQLVHFERFLTDPGETAPPAWNLESDEQIDLNRFALLEVWPDGNQAFIWLDTPEKNLFLISQFGVPLAQQIERLLEPFYMADSHLPPIPHERHLRALAQALILPVKDHIPGPRLLIIAHQEAQNLPFEMLPISDKQLLMDRYVISYLPSLSIEKPVPLSEATGAGLIVAPEVFGSGRKGGEVSRLQCLFPGSRLIDAWDGADHLQAPWIHISSHFQLDPHFWVASRLDGKTRWRHWFELLSLRPRCRLLSLAVCDSANGYLSDSPYWLGFGELFLLAGADSLVASRWKLDHLSVEIFEELFSYCRQGMAIDEALTKARRRFRLRRLQREEIEISGSHPFFWAGLSFIGWPETHLFEPPRGGSGARKDLPGIVLALLSFILPFLQKG